MAEVMNPSTMNRIFLAIRLTDVQAVYRNSDCPTVIDL